MKKNYNRWIKTTTRAHGVFFVLFDSIGKKTTAITRADLGIFDPCPHAEIYSIELFDGYADQD